jgi:peptide/nickel transport system permease protein
MLFPDRSTGKAAVAVKEGSKVPVKRNISDRKKSSLLNGHASLFIGGMLFLFILLVAFFPGIFTPYSPSAHNLDIILKPPNAAHPFGTDNFGRDILSRVCYGAREDILIGFLAMIVPFITGTLIGLFAGYYGAAVDAILMRILDISSVFPFLVLVIGIVTILGPGVINLYIAIWLVGWRDYARLVRSEVLVEKNSEYVQAARSLGFSNLRIMLRHILPNVVNSAFVFAVSDVMMCILLGASLSFLGLGVQPPVPEWGAIISEGRPFMIQAWWTTTFPGVALVITGIAISFLGEGLSSILIRTGHEI